MLHTSSAIHSSSGYDPQDGRHHMRHLDRLRVTCATFFGVKSLQYWAYEFGFDISFERKTCERKIFYEGERVRTRFARLEA